MPVATPFKLQFRLAQVRKWAGQYDYAGEAELIAGPVADARSRGYLTREEFLAIGEWKSARPRKRYRSNAAEYVEEVTRLALAPSTTPRLAIQVLTLLDGVSWPTASVILHFCHPEPYPILDFRALWSLGVERVPTYTFALWEEYTRTTRELAEKAGVDLRTLDRALWKYSEVHQLSV